MDASQIVPQNRGGRVSTYQDEILVRNNGNLRSVGPSVDVRVRMSGAGPGAFQTPAINQVPRLRAATNDENIHYARDIPGRT